MAAEQKTRAESLMGTYDTGSQFCPFCDPSESRVFAQSDLAIALWDGYPVSPGHALIVPRRHVPNWFDASELEQSALLSLVNAAKPIIEHQFRPDGYNIGINNGAAAGQTVFHLHVHLIPRYSGDVDDPRGGVRHVIPAKANYTVGLDAAPMPNNLVK
jgi:diadenosine tetraphosphate (Ap4A) HIT family hydrolase